ncbi:MAG: hypothetical protein IKX32_00710 [Bacteroidales bacterium]|nr:hypothetical protein [Bacteroidales bacterium]
MFFESLSSEFEYGKFKGYELGEVLMCAPEYVKWAIEKTGGDVCVFSDRTIEEIESIFPEFVKSNPQLLEIIKEIQEEYYWEEDWEEELREREHNRKYDPSAYWNTD